MVVQKRKKEEKGKGWAPEEEEEPEGLRNILERLTDAVVGIGYTMEVWMRREEEKENVRGHPQLYVPLYIPCLL